MSLIDPWEYNDMLSDMANGNRFAFVRYGDGEFACMFGDPGGVRNEHRYTQDLAGELAACLKSEHGYHVGIMPGLFVPGKWPASERVIEYAARHPEIEFCSSLILHAASMHGTLHRFFDEARHHRLVVVGNKAILKMQPWLGAFEFIEIPSQECWNKRAEIQPVIIAAAQQPGIVLLSCSMPANVWIRRAWEAGGKASLIDIGSVFDPYVGASSRNYMREGRAILAERLY